MNVQNCGIEMRFHQTDQEILDGVGDSPEIGPDRIKFGNVRFLVPISPSIQLLEYRGMCLQLGLD